MIGLAAYLMGRDKEFPPTAKMLADANELLHRVDALFYDLGVTLEDEDVSSGYRPGHYNVEAGGSPNSTHVICQAIDIKDPKRRLTEKVLAAPHLLEKHGLFMEEPSFTKGWIHLDTRSRRKHIFRPY